MKNRIRIRPRFRIYVNAEIAIGPGKAQLLEAIDRTGSISEAARKLKMSYNRAWHLIRTANRCFRAPLVTAKRGGQAKGGASLTPLGKKVLDLYAQLNEKSLRTTRPIWTRLKKELR